MQAADLPRRSAAGRVGRIIYASGVLVPLIFVLVIVCYAPVTDYHELDPDEGVNLMKAFLVSKGHSLYTEIWDDQPPLLTLVLAGWFKWFGASLAASRVLVLLFSALLLWAFYRTIRLGVSEPAALISVALLVLASYYVRLSISVMIGLPAIALAMLSLYLLLVGQRSGRSALTLVSGIFFGLSIQTKLFTGLLAPIIVIYLCFLNEPGARQAAPFRRRLGTCALWLGAMGAAFLVTGVLARSFDPLQLITPHLGEQTRTSYRFANNRAYVAEFLSNHMGYLPLAVVGAIWGLKRRMPTMFLALGWLAAALAFLLYEEPLWYHHFLFATVPLAWLGALGVEAGLRAFGLRDRVRAIGTPALPRRLAWLSSMLVVGVLVIFDLVSRGRAFPSELIFIGYNQGIVNRLCPDARSKPTWVFSDRPIYAFQAGLVVPPPAAVVSKKRLDSGELTEDMLLEIIRSYRPKHVVLERFFSYLSQNFKEALGEDYVVLQGYYNNDNKVVAQILVARPVSVGHGAGSGQAPARVVFDNWLTLQWTPALLGDQIEAGNCLGMPGLMWQRGATHAGRDLGLSVRLTDEDGNVLAQYDEPLGSDFNTMRDRVQMPYFLNFLIPEGTPPGNYDLTLIVYDPQTGRPREATGGAGASGGGEMLGQVRVDRPAEALALRPALADFGPIRLIKADTPATVVSPGDEVPLALLWQADVEHYGESLVAAQLLDNQGKVVAGLEEEPLSGRYGTAGWQPGELVRDHHALSVPADTPPGRYNLIVGLYRLPTRERLKTPAGLLGWGTRDYFLLRQIEVR